MFYEAFINIILPVNHTRSAPPTTARHDAKRKNHRHSIFDRISCPYSHGNRHLRRSDSSSRDRLVCQRLRVAVTQLHPACSAKRDDRQRFRVSVRVARAACGAREISCVVWCVVRYLVVCSRLNISANAWPKGASPTPFTGPCRPDVVT